MESRRRFASESPRGSAGPFGRRSERVRVVSAGEYGNSPRWHPILSAALVAGAVVAGSFALRGRERTLLDLESLARQVKEHLPVSPSVASSMGVIDRARVLVTSAQHFVTPARMIELMRRAAREGRDVLADFETLATARSSAAGDEPLAVRFISLPSFDL